jgi:hypothetical protein
MPTITTFTEPAFGRVRLEIDFSDTPAATHFHVHRSLDGSPSHAVDPVLRMYGSGIESFTDAFGTWDLKRLSDGRAVLYDTELPLDTPVWYRLDTSQVLSAAFDDVGSVTVASSGMVWLKDPVRPAHDLSATVPAGVSDPTCDPTSGVYVVGFDPSQYRSASGQFPVEASPYPSVAARPRKGPTFGLTLVTRLLTDRDRLRTLLSSGGALLMQTPAEWGYGDMYVDVGDVTEGRLARDHRKPWRLWTLPLVQTSQPPGLQFGVDAARWQDLCDVYPTWGDVEAAGKTWVDVLQREAG